MSDLIDMEFTASEVQVLLQQLFPKRKLVLSQLTFFLQAGVARPTGESFCRKRRCYRLADILPIACVLQLKEEGIPLKNIADVPSILQNNLSRIFNVCCGTDSANSCRLMGCGGNVSLIFNDSENPKSAHQMLIEMLGISAGSDDRDPYSVDHTDYSASTNSSGGLLGGGLLWGIDVSAIAMQLMEAANSSDRMIRRAA